MSNPVDVSKMSPELKAAMLKKVAAEMWRRGSLRYKFHETQKKIVAALEASKERRFYLLCSRRLGKTYALLILAFEMAIQKPGSRILYLAPFAKDAAEIAVDTAGKLLEDCPEEYRPSYNSQQKEFTFKRPGQVESIVRLKGVNSESAQFLRGGAADLVILDECGIMDDLDYVMSSVVMPMTMTTGGRIILATTPPRSPGHDSAVIYEKLAQLNSAVSFDIRQAPHISDDIKGEYLHVAGESADEVGAILRGEQEPRTTTAKREYFCEFVTDENSAVLPEFTAEARKEIVVESPRPPFFDAYVGMDPGVVDRTGILYGYFDFKRHKLVVEDESLLRGPSTLAIAEEINAKEQKLWGGKKPYMRVSDVEKRLIIDLHERHQLSFVQTEKQDSQGAINFVRNLIQTRQLEINPRCVNLVRQMQAAIWNARVTDFDRGGEKSEFGHYDLVAALKYFCRNINWRKNPYPPGYGFTRDENVFYDGRQSRLSRAQGMGLLAKTPAMKRLVAAKKKERTGL